MNILKLINSIRSMKRRDLIRTVVIAAVLLAAAYYLVVFIVGYINRDKIFATGHDRSRRN